MAAEDWKYVQNQFLSSTAHSRPRMQRAGTDHLAKLLAALGTPPNVDADIQACLDRVQPLFDAFENAYVTWQVRSGQREGETDLLGNLLDELSSSRIAQWDITVQNVFLRGTPDYAKILPKGRGPFQKGGQEARILAVKTLAEALAPYAQFAALRTSVQTFHTTLKTARDEQQGTEGEIATASQNCEDARVALAIGLYANLGRLMEKFAAEPLRVADFFDPSLLRDKAGKPPVPSGSDMFPLHKKLQEG